MKNIKGELNMSTRIRKIVTVIAAFAIAFTSLPVMGSGIDAHAVAVKAPAQVKNLKVKKIKQTSVVLRWSKIKKNKNTKGYAIYRNGKLIKRVNSKTSSFKVTKLKAGTKYKFAVRAYNTYKQKQYYNTKTKKWQTKKPSGKYWKGKRTRKVTAYKFGKKSAVRQVITKKITNGDKKVGSQINIDAARNEMLKQINALRKEKGEAPLIIEATLNKTAQEKAKDFVTNNYFDHYSKKLGYPNEQYFNHNMKPGYWGENIVERSYTVNKAMTAWKESRGHLANMLDPNFTHVGLGYSNGYWVQQFSDTPVYTDNHGKCVVVTCYNCGAKCKECDFYGAYFNTGCPGEIGGREYICRSCGCLIPLCKYDKGSMKIAGITENGSTAFKCIECGRSNSKKCYETCSSCGSKVIGNNGEDDFTVTFYCKGSFMQSLMELFYCKKCNKYFMAPDFYLNSYVENYNMVKDEHDSDVYSYIEWKKDGKIIPTPEVDSLEKLVGQGRLK